MNKSIYLSYKPFEFLHKTFLKAFDFKIFCLIKCNYYITYFVK